MALKKHGHLNLDISSDTYISPGETMLVLGNNNDIHKCFHI